MPYSPDFFYKDVSAMQLSAMELRLCNNYIAKFRKELRL